MKKKQVVDTTRKYLTPKEVAEILGIGYDTVLARIKEGAIPVLMKTHGRYLIPKDWVDRKAEK